MYDVLCIKISYFSILYLNLVCKCNDLKNRYLALIHPETASPSNFAVKHMYNMPYM